MSTLRSPGENRGGAVAVMNVAIDDQGFFDQTLILQRADGDSDVVDGAKTFAVGRKRVMKSSADVESDAIAQRVAGRQNGPAGGQPKALHHLARVRNFELDDLGFGQRSGFQAMHPAGIVDSQHIVIGSGLGFDEIGRLGEAFFEQRCVNQPVLARGKHMVAEVEIVARMINELERQHAAYGFGLAPAVLLYGGIVLLNRFRELMPAGAIGLGDKIEIICFGRRERGFERCHARIRDGSGRKARVTIGIVSVVALQIGTIDGSAIAGLEQRRVNGGGIAIQRHSLAQPVFIHGRDDRPVLGTPGFFFHQRCQSHDFVHRLRCAGMPAARATACGTGWSSCAQSCCTVVERVMR